MGLNLIITGVLLILSLSVVVYVEYCRVELSTRCSIFFLLLCKLKEKHKGCRRRIKFSRFFFYPSHLSNTPPSLPSPSVSAQDLRTWCNFFLFKLVIREPKNLNKFKKEKQLIRKWRVQRRNMRIRQFYFIYI